MNYDDFELHRPEDNLKNKSDVDLEQFRSQAGVNKETGLYEGNGTSLNDDVDAYAKNLGLSDGTHFNYNDMAKKVGMENFDPNSASDKEELRDKLKDIQEHKLNEQKQNKSDSNAINVKNNYSKANSGREAYKRTLNNKNYYDQQKKNNQDKQEKLKNKNQETKEKQKASNDRLQKAKANTAGKNRRQQTDEEKKELKDAKKENKELKKNEKKSKKESKNLKKELKNIKKDKTKALMFAITHPLEALKLKIINRLKVILLVSAIVFFFTVAIISAILGTIESIMEALDKVMYPIVNTHEKFDNFYNNLGFQNSEEAFIDEVKYLDRKYDYTLDLPLIMATLFYDDMHSDEDGTTVYDDGIGVAMVYNKLKDYFKESNVTIDKKTGLVYSSNKIYRLRLLAKHSIDGVIFKTRTTEKTVGLLEYIKQCKDQIGDEIYQVFEALIPTLLKVLTNGTSEITNFTESLYQVLFKDEPIETTDSYQAVIGDGSIRHLCNLFYTMFTSFSDVASVNFGCEDVICVTYKTYEFNEKDYERYLREEYIRKMPEFKKYIKTDDEETKNILIDEIIEEIKDTKYAYEEIYGKVKQTTEFYNNTCQGNIKPLLINELRKPVDTSSTVNFSGNYSYGTSNGSLHRGVDLNSETSGNKEGDSVYSIYDHGTVIASTYDNTYKCDGCKGGWVEISYSAGLSDGIYRFTAVYGGLKKESLNLKKGDLINNKGDTIGTIGGVDNSEVSIASLHFGIYETESNTYLNPTNLFIQCSSFGGTLRGNSNEEKIWNYLLDYGYSEAGIAGVMGNWQAESGFSPNNIENCATVFSEDTFASQIAAGTITKDQFIKYKGNGCEKSYPNNKTYAAGAYGYGLAQWTNQGRKGNMYDYWQSSGYNIDDLLFQLEWYIHEANGYAGLHDSLKTATDPYEAARLYEKTYEGSLGGLGKRGENATILYNKWKGKSTRMPFGSSTSTPNYAEANSGSTAKINAYVQKLIEYANDDTHGYSQANRTLPDVDCSSFVYYGLVHSGTIPTQSYPFNTSSMGGVLKQNGFDEIPYDLSILQKGDIVVNPGTHTAVFIGQGQEVAAHSCNGIGQSCLPGDQNGTEVSVNVYKSDNYKYIYRLK